MRLPAEQLQLMRKGLDAAAADAEIPDQRLALMFACAHPAIDVRHSRAVDAASRCSGSNAAMIASAFLMSPATMGQRLVRAKNKIRQAGIPFRIPEREELLSRLDAVLDAIYAAFAEGWTDPGRDRCRAPRSCRGSHVSGQTGDGVAAAGAGGAGPAGADASRGSPASSAAECAWRVRAACRAGSSLWDCADDR